jgi:hypothetical protein
MSHVGRNLSTTLTPEQIHRLSAFATWFQGMVYLHSNNAGSSINLASTLFDWNDIDASHFSRYNLQTSIYANINGLSTISPHFLHVNNVFKEERAAALYHYASTNIAPPVDGATPTGEPNDQVLQALIALLNKSTTATHTMTSTECDQLREAEEVEHRFMLHQD